MKSSYKLRAAPGGASQITLPRELAALVPPDAYFEPVLVEDGILFKLIQAPARDELPSWARDAPKK